MSSREGICAYPWQQMNIDLTGEVVPCCFWSGYGNTGKPLGNTNEQTLEEIWNGEAYQELRRANASGDLKPGHPCHQCLAWQWGGRTYPKFEWPVVFRREEGHCFTMPVPERIREAVAGGEGPVVLTEDGEPLAQPDAVHDEIREQGAGRYSVWGETLYFSSSDNSDARRNGRDYELRCGPYVTRLANFKPESTSGRNLIRAHAEYEDGATVMAARPSLLSFIATADCNIDCPACSQNTVRLLRVQHRERTELDVLELVPYLNQFIWHGGEPYLIKRFREFVDGFRDEANPNLTFGFTSNGTLLTAEELAKLEKFPRINATISIDSFVRETFDVIRAGANFDTVLRNTLRAVERFDESDFVMNVGMIITKLNFAELPVNLKFAMEHGVGLNLSPVVVYPVTERIDVFEDFARETAGWEAALDEAEQVLEEARRGGAKALQRIDPTGHVRALRAIWSRAAERHATTFAIDVSVVDPTGSMAKMRRPGIIVSREGQQDHPLAYVDLARGPGEYRLEVPLEDLSGPVSVAWFLVHDLLEPMGVLDMDAFLDEQGRQLPESDWSRVPSTLFVEVPPFKRVPRPRNVALANRGLPTGDGLHVVEPAQLFEAYRRLVESEASRGRGYVVAYRDESYRTYFNNRIRGLRYGGFRSPA